MESALNRSTHSEADDEELLDIIQQSQTSKFLTKQIEMEDDSIRKSRFIRCGGTGADSEDMRIMRICKGGATSCINSNSIKKTHQICSTTEQAGVHASFDMEEDTSTSSMELSSEKDALPLTQLRNHATVQPSWSCVAPGAFLDGRYRADRFHSWMIQDDQQDSPSALPLSPPPIEAQHHHQSLPEEGENAELVVANPVIDLEAQDTLPKAEELDASSRRDSGGPHQTKKKAPTDCPLIVMIIVGIAAAAALIVLLLVFLLPSEVSPSATGPSDYSTSTSSHDPSSSIQAHVLDLLPEDTILALKNEGSYQTKAFDWILSDPNLTNYSDKRILQRFSLACLYFATDGNNWNNNTHWLSYEHHECQWSSPDLLNTVKAGHIGDNYFAKVNPIIAEWNNESFPCSTPLSLIDDQLYTHLWAFGNNLQGLIPQEIYLLTNLKTLVLLASRFQAATLSTNIGRLTSLESLAITYSKLGGNIPTQVGLLTNLNSLYLQANDLGGSIPSELGLLSDSLSAEIHLGGNRFNGTVPSQLGSLSQVHRLLLLNNELSGSIPTQVGVMKGLKRLALYQNRLTGAIPSQLGKLEELERILSHGNQLSGRLPSQLGCIGSLEMILLEDNQISGALPSEFSLLTNLGRMSLSQNNLSGTIPSEMTFLATNGSLFALDVSGNNLSGKASEGLCDIGANITACPRYPFLPRYECSFQFDCSGNLCGCGCPC